MLSVTIKGAKQLRRALRAKRALYRKTLNTAIRVEGFNLSNVLKAEIRKGAPGGKRFKPLSFIAASIYARKGRPRSRPLQRLALAVRYHIIERDPIELAVGFAGPKVSKRWKYLAKIHQEGFTRDISEKQRLYIRSRGYRLREDIAGGGRSKARSKYFFLNRSTIQFRTPARPIIAPFWLRYQRQTQENIVNNWKRKLRGERI